MAERARADWVDRTVQLILLAVTVLYLASLPHNLGYADDSYFLYESKRIRDGEVLYRDVFQYVTPLSPYVMALLFRLFGTTMTTARVSMAVLHGLIVVFAYAAARELRVRRPLAAVAALAHVGIAQPAWPFASWHWFSSAAAAGILLALLRPSGGSRTRALGLGLLCGLLVDVQQQRGMMPTFGIALLLLIDHGIDRWYGGRKPWRSAWEQVALFATGVALVVVPTLLAFVYVAGPEPVYHALVRFPLENYRASAPYVTWGQVGALSAPYATDTFPRLLALLPLLMGIPLVRALVLVARTRERVRVHQLTALVLVGGAAVLSIGYNDDFIHIAFIVVPFLIAAAVAVEWALDLLPLPYPVARGVAWAVALVTAAAIAHQLSSRMGRKWEQYPYTHDTAFGRVEFHKRSEVQLVDVLRDRLRNSPSQEIFCYPNLASPYLTTGGKNPTPFQHFSTWVFPPRDVERVLATLAERRVPYIVAAPLALRPEDPITQLLNRDYELVDLGTLPPLWLYQRKDAAP